MAWTASRKKAAFLVLRSTRCTQRPRHIRQRAGDDHTRKPGSRAEIDPDSRLRRQRQKLKRIGDVTGPQFWLGGRRDQVHPLLPFQQHSDKAVEPIQCFT